MTKLRQKHPGAVRVAEEGRGRVVVDNSASLIVNKAHSLSHHIPALCKEAKETTFAPEHLLKQYQEGSLGQGKAAGQTRRENKDVAFFSKSLGGVYSGLGRARLLARPGGRTRTWPSSARAWVVCTVAWAGQGCWPDQEGEQGRGLLQQEPGWCVQWPGQGKAAGQTRRENKDVAFFSKSLGGVYS